MSQVPLAPPPPTGGPIDGWLYLLWKRVTAAGQILWSSIVPSTSADVAAVVTDETGSPGSLVFSGNPTLQGLNVTTAAFTSRGITDNATATALTLETSAGSVPLVGLGVTPNSAWTVVAGVIQFGTQAFVYGGGSGGFVVGNNLYYNGAFRYSVTGSYASYYSQGPANGDHIFTSTAATGTAGNIATLLEKGRLTSGGTFTVGGTVNDPALKVTPVASQARWIEVTGATSSTHPKIAASGGSLEITTGINLPIATNTGATLTITDAHHTIIQTTAASVYTLPTASSYTGRCLRIVTQFAGTVTSASSNVVPLAGGAAGTAILAATAGKWADLQSNGTNWIIVASN